MGVNPPRRSPVSLACAVHFPRQNDHREAADDGDPAGRLGNGSAAVVAATVIAAAVVAAARVAAAIVPAAGARKGRGAAIERCAVLEGDVTERGQAEIYGHEKGERDGM